VNSLVKFELHKKKTLLRQQQGLFEKYFFIYRQAIDLRSA
jgi:hypothetical protein